MTVVDVLLPMMRGMHGITDVNRSIIDANKMIVNIVGL
jgi:hypothetical protein